MAAGQGKKTTCIYGLFDPRTNLCFYVGKANNPKTRLKEHLTCTTNLSKAVVIESLRAQGLIPEIRTLELTPIDKWESAEIYWIRQMRNEGHPLTNISPGGVLPGPMTIEQAEWLLEEMSNRIDDFEQCLDNALKHPLRLNARLKPLESSINEFREASFKAMRKLTRQLIEHPDIVVRLKVAYSMNRTMRRLSVL